MVQLNRTVTLHTGTQLILAEGRWWDMSGDSHFVDNDETMNRRVMRTLDLAQNGPRPGLGRPQDYVLEVYGPEDVTEYWRERAKLAIESGTFGSDEEDGGVASLALTLMAFHAANENPDASAISWSEEYCESGRVAVVR